MTKVRNISQFAPNNVIFGGAKILVNIQNEDEPKKHISTVKVLTTSARITNSIKIRDLD